MKVIDLLNKISNGEELPLIKYRDKILHWNKEKDRFENEDGMNTLYEMDFSELNDEVEVIEEDKKIKHIESYVDFANLNDSVKFDYLYEMITRIIDKLNSMENK